MNHSSLIACRSNWKEGLVNIVLSDVNVSIIIAHHLRKQMQQVHYGLETRTSFTNQILVIFITFSIIFNSISQKKHDNLGITTYNYYPLPFNI